MKPKIYQDFPELKGKIVEQVELSAEADYYGITFRFDDGTGITFSIDSEITVSASYADWTTGDERILQQWKQTPFRNMRIGTEARLKES